MEDPVNTLPPSNSQHTVSSPVTQPFQIALAASPSSTPTPRPADSPTTAASASSSTTTSPLSLGATSRMKSFTPSSRAAGAVLNASGAEGNQGEEISPPPASAAAAAVPQTNGHTNMDTSDSSSAAASASATSADAASSSTPIIPSTLPVLEASVSSSSEPASIPSAATSPAVAALSSSPSSSAGTPPTIERMPSKERLGVGGIPMAPALPQAFNLGHYYQAKLSGGGSLPLRGPTTGGAAAPGGSAPNSTPASPQQATTSLTQVAAANLAAAGAAASSAVPSVIHGAIPHRPIPRARIPSPSSTSTNSPLPLAQFHLPQRGPPQQQQQAGTQQQQQQGVQQANGGHLGLRPAGAAGETTQPDQTGQLYGSNHMHPLDTSHQTGSPVPASFPTSMLALHHQQHVPPQQAPASHNISPMPMHSMYNMAGMNGGQLLTPLSYLSPFASQFHSPLPNVQGVPLAQAMTMGTPPQVHRSSPQAQQQQQQQQGDAQQAQPSQPDNVKGEPSQPAGQQQQPSSGPSSREPSPAAPAVSNTATGGVAAADASSSDAAANAMTRPAGATAPTPAENAQEQQQQQSTSSAAAASGITNHASGLIQASMPSPSGPPLGSANSQNLYSTMFAGMGSYPSSPLNQTPLPMYHPGQESTMTPMPFYLQNSPPQQMMHVQQQLHQQQAQPSGFPQLVSPPSSTLPLRPPSSGPTTGSPLPLVPPQPETGYMQQLATLQAQISQMTQSNDVLAKQYHQSQQPMSGVGQMSPQQMPSGVTAQPSAGPAGDPSAAQALQQQQQTRQMFGLGASPPMLQHSPLPIYPPTHPSPGHSTSSSSSNASGAMPGSDPEYMILQHLQAQLTMQLKQQQEQLQQQAMQIQYQQQQHSLYMEQLEKRAMAPLQYVYNPATSMYSTQPQLSQQTASPFYTTNMRHMQPGMSPQQDQRLQQQQQAWRPDNGVQQYGMNMDQYYGTLDMQKGAGGNGNGLGYNGARGPLSTQSSSNLLSPEMQQHSLRPQVINSQASLVAAASNVSHRSSLYMPSSSSSHPSSHAHAHAQSLHLSSSSSSRGVRENRSQHQRYTDGLADGEGEGEEEAEEEEEGGQQEEEQHGGGTDHSASPSESEAPPQDEDDSDEYTRKRSSASKPRAPPKKKQRASGGGAAPKPRSCAARASLPEPIIIATGAKKTATKFYPCSHDGCTELLKTRFSLKRHMKKHTGEKPHMCPYSECGKSFPEASTLKRHLRIHTGEKPFKCSFAGCQKAFADATNVKRHEMTHTGEKPYRCLVTGCPRSFSRGSSLRQHMVSLHHLDPSDPTLLQSIKRGRLMKQKKRRLKANEVLEEESLRNAGVAEVMAQHGITFPAATGRPQVRKPTSGAAAGGAMQGQKGRPDGGAGKRKRDDEEEEDEEEESSEEGSEISEEEDAEQ